MILMVGAGYLPQEHGGGGVVLLAPREVRTAAAEGAHLVQSAPRGGHDHAPVFRQPRPANDLSVGDERLPRQCHRSLSGASAGAAQPAHAGAVLLVVAAPHQRVSVAGRRGHREVHGGGE